MKRQLTSVASGLPLVDATLLRSSATAQAAPAGAPTGDPAEAQGLVLNGCVITADADTVVFGVGGTGLGNGRVYHVKASAIPDYDAATTADACSAIVVDQKDGVWYAESITVTRDEDGEIQVNQNSGSRPVGPRGR